MAIEFFMAMAKVPTITDQKKRLGVTSKGKPYTYKQQEIVEAKAKLMAHLAGHVPQTPYTGPVRLTVKWCFLATGKQRNGQYRATRPDTDNLQKMLKDCMTELHFWEDDCLVVSEIIEKFWADVPGIYIRIEEIHQEA